MVNLFDLVNGPQPRWHRLHVGSMLRKHPQFITQQTGGDINSNDDFHDKGDEDPIYKSMPALQAHLGIRSEFLSLLTSTEMLSDVL